nr:metallophosphoesterase [uncultured Holophaga sp.]
MVRLILLPLLLCCALLGAQEDGPHVLWRKGSASILHLIRGQVRVENLKPPFHLDLPGLSTAGADLDGRPWPAAGESFPLPARVFALSDIHGQLDTARRLLQAQGVADTTGRWTFGKGHLVVVGDTLDRGPQVTEALWFLYSLAQQAQRAGGKVHVLLGNHEQLVLTGRYRYTHPKYLQSREGMPPLAALYGPDSELGRWLRSRPAALRLGPLLFVHGGFSRAWLALGLDLGTTNTLLRRSLEDHPLPGTPEAVLAGEEGPLWYRGLLPGLEPPLTHTDLDRVFASTGTRLLIVGHTTLPQVTSFHEGRVFAIDAGLKGGQHGEGWLWAKGRAYRALEDGSTRPF